MPSRYVGCRLTRLKLLKELGTAILLYFLAGSGCISYYAVGFVAPTMRIDRAQNRPIPKESNPKVARSIFKWESLGPEAQKKYPTPYHVYVDTPDPRGMEEECVVSLAFSGGGSRAAMFGAYCVLELEQIATRHSKTSVNFLDQVDYVSGISGGALPATCFALAAGAKENALFEPFMLRHWPDIFDKSLQMRAARSLITHPNMLLRDFVVDVNFRPSLIHAINNTTLKLEGSDAKRLTFADLPRSPILLLGASVITEPTSPLLLTRLPYRYSFPKESNLPWNVEMRTLESFQSDPMTYPLATAIYNSASFPALLRSGILRMQDDPDWLLDKLAKPDHEVQRRNQMAARSSVSIQTYDKLESNAANSLGHEVLKRGRRPVYELKDGGLWDNRGVDYLLRIVDNTGTKRKAKKAIMLCDASPRGISAPRRHSTSPEKNWLKELVGSTYFAWDTGQVALSRSTRARADALGIEYFPFNYLDLVTDYFRAPDGNQEKKQIRVQIFEEQEQIRHEDRIESVEELLSVMRTIKTDFGKFSTKQKNALHICAAYAVRVREKAIVDYFRV